LSKHFVLEGIHIMKNVRKLSALLVLAALGAGAQAQSDLSRAQVQAETLQAIQSGDVLVGGEAGLTARQLNPGQYPQQTVAKSTLTRGEVLAQVARSLATGQALVQGEAGGALNSTGQAATDVALASVTQHPTRAQVKAELAAAIRSGDILVAGEAGLKANQLNPGRYAPAHATAANVANAPAATAAGY
jgi:hypothetical protein